MALTYDKVINVISQRPDQRKDFEVNNLLPWFRKKSPLFNSLKSELMFDIIKNLQFVTKDRDDLIIKQGEQGDCMYILLRGQVTIFILYAAKGDADEEKPNQLQLNSAKVGSEALRQQLGTFVTNLGAGATFGEVALMSDDCIRTASIIVNEPTDLIVVDRELYNRSVKNVLKKEFEDKSNFIATNPHFQGWPPKYKKQLAMALQIERFPYEGMVTKQGEPVDAIYFILNGEVKVIVDPQLHKTQYSKLFEQEEFNINSDKPKAVVPEEVDEEQSRENSAVSLDPELAHRFRRKTAKKQHQEVCLLGQNESLGDIEVLLDLDSYLQTSLCTQRTEVLVLEMKHYERLLIKRNPRTIEAMKGDLELRLKSRINKHLEKSVPVLKNLFAKAEEYNVQRQQQVEARHNAGQEKHSKHPKTMGETFDSFVPPQGALIDMYGPGTVFYRIRQREAAKIKKQERLRNKNAYSGFHSLSGAALSNPADESRAIDAHALGGALNNFGSGLQQVDPLTSDPVLSNLEERMKTWLANEYSAQNPNSIANSKAQPRIAKLHRGSADADRVKPGARVVLRPRDHNSHSAENSVLADGGGNQNDWT